MEQDHPAPIMLYSIGTMDFKCYAQKEIRLLNTGLFAEMVRQFGIVCLSGIYTKQMLTGGMNASLFPDI